MLDSDTWNHLTVCKQMSSNKLLKNKVTNKWFAEKSYKQNLALNNPQCLIYRHDNMRCLLVLKEYDVFFI